LKRNPDSPDGFVVVDKPAGITSSDALKPLHHVFGTGRIGHAGTLDSFATGTLVALVGRYARLAPWFTGCDKAYRGTVRFGAETATLDPSGELVGEGPLPTREALEAALPAFRGKIMQAPPAWSAVHIDGKRAWQRARDGEDVAPAAREVTIHSLELESFDGRDAVILVRCSKGTYIRSMARDLALASGSRGHLVALRRLASGPFLANSGHAPDAVTPENLRSLRIGEAAALGLVTLRAEGDAARRVLSGGRLHPRDFAAAGVKDDPGADGDEVEAKGAEACAVFDADGRLLAIVERSGARFAYLAVMG